MVYDGLDEGLFDSVLLLMYASTVIAHEDAVIYRDVNVIKCLKQKLRVIMLILFQLILY